MKQLILLGYEFITVMLPSVAVILVFRLCRGKEQNRFHKEHLIGCLIFSCYLFALLHITGAGTLYDGFRYGLNSKLINLIPFSDTNIDILGYFLNVVEEPEQNLFPQSQMKNLEFLLDCANCNMNNKLVITTHSPYILSYITLAAKVFDLLKRGVPKERLENIVPVQSAVDGNQVFIYETQQDGSIKKLESYDNLPSDENLLNKAMALGNELFAELLDLEQEFCQ